MLGSSRSSFFSSSLFSSSFLFGSVVGIVFVLRGVGSGAQSTHTSFSPFTEGGAFAGGGFVEVIVQSILLVMG